MSVCDQNSYKKIGYILTTVTRVKDFLNKTVKAMVDVRVHSVSSSSQR